MTDPGTPAAPEPSTSGTTGHQPSDPPPGPGVQPPFAAPPINRDHTRLWIGLGVGALALVVCCVGGLFGLGILAVAGSNQLTGQARQVVSDYLGALRDGKYATAYDQLCESLRQRESEPDFAVRMAGQPRVVAFTVGTPRIANQIEVPADVTVAPGTRQTRSFTLAQDRSAETELKICGITQ